jgi:hypothetical protein
MVEIFALVSTVVAWLTPTLPYIISGSEEAVKSFGEKLGEGAFEKAKDLYHLLRPSIDSRPAAKEAVIDASTAPNDKVVLSALEMQLRKMLTDDPELASRVSSFVDSNSATGNMIVAYGARSIAAGSISNSTLITGDHNTVS